MRTAWIAIAIAGAACGSHADGDRSGSGSASAAPAPAPSPAPPPAAPVGLTLVGCTAAPLVPGVVRSTIGTGRYGTISGHGAGYGVGGGGGPSASFGPTVHVGQPVVTGSGLEPPIIRRYIKRNESKIQYCYEKALLAKPTIHGTLTTQFAIRADGTVLDPTASGVDPDVSSCVAGVIGGIEFPKPAGGATLQVSYPFTFDPPPTYDTGAPATDDGADPGTVAVDDGADVTVDPPPASPTGIAWLPMQTRAADAPDDQTAAVVAATRTALAAKLAGTDACVQHAPAGSLRAILRVGPRDVDVQVGGLGDAGAEACIAKALAELKVPAPKELEVGVDVACDLVHGAPAPWRVTPTPAFGLVEVTPDRMTYAGHVESHFPGGVPYLVAADADVRGVELARALVKTKGSDQIIVALRDGDHAPAFIGQLASDGDRGGATIVTVGGAAVTACVNATPHAAKGADAAAIDALAAELAAPCKAACKGAAVLSLDATGTVGDLARVSDRLRAAGFDRVAIARDATCRP